jgi:hypothetical protein
LPFQSKAQMGAAFGGYLGPEMKSKAKQWAAETPNIKGLPSHKGMFGRVKALKKQGMIGRAKGADVSNL